MPFKSDNLYMKTRENLPDQNNGGKGETNFTRRKS